MGHQYSSTSKKAPIEMTMPDMAARRSAVAIAALALPPWGRADPGSICSAPVVNCQRDVSAYLGMLAAAGIPVVHLGVQRDD